MPDFKVEDLSAGYKDKILFRNISFSLSDPKFVAVVGHNGSGKSTFLKVLSNKMPFQGKVFLKGHDISKIPQKNLSARIAFLEQRNFITFSIPVIELVVMGLFRKKKLFQSYSKNDYEEAHKALKTLNIDHLSDKNFPELSGGEQQMVWIAQLMLQNSDFWLLDEPTQQLDLYNRKQIFNLLGKIITDKNKTVICITHDIHCLSQFEGHYLINFSETNPKLKIISPKTLAETIFILENEG